MRELRRADPARPGDFGIYSVIAGEGDCRLYGSQLECDPWCGTDQECINGVCRRLPTFVSVGDITVDGLGDRRTLLHDPLRPDMYVGEQDGTADGMIDAGAAITVMAEGGAELPAFTATVSGVSAIASTIERGAILELRDADDVELTWSAPEEGARVRLVFRTAEYDHFGYSEEKLVCDLPDRGSLRVPGSLIGQLPEMQLGFDQDPNSFHAGGAPGVASGLIRYRASSVDTEAGRIEVIAASELLFWALH
ncbi:MAG TPA: hypothetical protein VFU21_29160 [Kofleriaceae bacterium]|nr:hypothetical protein [Kofleriaceae bacterium]